jgi:GNAT superfamily N-acetyltransferase
MSAIVVISVLYRLNCLREDAILFFWQVHMIRIAKLVDVSAMALLWHERLTLQQQTDRRYQIAPDGLARWSAAVSDWLEDDQYIVYVAEFDSRIVGYIIGCVQASPPGVLPDRVGTILEIAIGAHSDQRGLGRQLLEPVRTWFWGCGVTHLIAYVPHRQPVEQAFWRALGASELIDMMWMKL